MESLSHPAANADEHQKFAAAVVWQLVTLAARCASAEGPPPAAELRAALWLRLRVLVFLAPTMVAQKKEKARDCVLCASATIHSRSPPPCTSGGSLRASLDLCRLGVDVDTHGGFAVCLNPRINRAAN